MPEPRPSDRTPAERQADHAALARLSDTLMPALVQKLNGSALGELEVREGAWSIRIRRPTGAAAHARRERQRPAISTRPHAAPAAPRDPTREAVSAPAVGVFRATATVGTRLRTGDKLGVVDLLGIPQDVVSPIDGILVDILVDTGDAVEYGEEVAVVQEPAPPPGEVVSPADAAAQDATAGEGQA
jgi:biotin carboxyl carrier protein